MVKIINDRYDLLEFKNSNTYDFTNYEVIIITFDFSTKCTIKANKIICCNLTVPNINCTSLSSYCDINCQSIKASTIICNKLISKYIIANSIQAMEIKGFNSTSAFNISCNKILSLSIKCHYIKCDYCYTDFINAREDHIKYMYTFDEYTI